MRYHSNFNYVDTKIQQKSKFYKLNISKTYRKNIKVKKIIAIQKKNTYTNKKGEI